MKKLQFKSVCVTELNSQQLNKIAGGNITTIDNPYTPTGPKDGYSINCDQ